MRILLISEEKSQNLGDQVIFKVSQELFKRHTGNSVNHADISYARWLIRKIPRLESFLKFLSNSLYDNLVRILSKYFFLLKTRRVDRVVFAGGALLQDYFMIPILELLDICKRRNIQVAFFSVGYGVISSKFMNQFKDCLANVIVQGFSTRDDLRYVSNYLWPKAVNKPDIALLASDLYKRAKNQERLIGVGCINPSIYSGDRMITDDYYCSTIKNIIRSAEFLGFQVELFCNGDANDYDFCKRIYLKCQSQNVFLSNKPQKERDLIDTITKYSMVISSRLHSLIIASSFNVPTICLSWDHKINDFARMTSNAFVYDLASAKDTNWIEVIRGRERITLACIDSFKDDIRKQIREYSI